MVAALLHGVKRDGHIYVPPSDPTPAKRPRVEQPPTTPANGAQTGKKWEVCDETMKRIFATVKNYPALYDPKNADFGNEEQHAELWRVIALELDLPDAQKRWENIFVRNCTHGRDRMLVKKQYRDELRWLEPNVQAVGKAVFQRKGTKVIEEVRKLPELHDPAHPRYNDETHVKALWQQLTDTMDVGDAKTQWSHWLRSMAEGKTASDGFWYAKEMEWMRPFLKQPLAKPPQPVKESNEDVTKRMIDSMAKMLRQLTMDKRVQAYERFREVVAEVNGEGNEETGTEKCPISI
ncbi:hypothetical protein AAVH_33967 [Aphelenchoides avenae]|nr:hypothetical protein AAVH_33967 [Aphelenchus avenae]